MDFMMGFILLMVFSPLLLIISLLLFITFQGNPFFIQERIGQNNVLFKLIKFKTYREMGRPDSIPLIGKILRITSLDELPQLINIIKGEMSFIGPRPLLPEYLPFYTKEEVSRHRVKPGLSGLSQLKIGNTSEWNKRLAYDVQYVNNQSIRLDCKILLQTLLLLFFLRRRNRQDVPIESFADFAKRR